MPRRRTTKAKQVHAKPQMPSAIFSDNIPLSEKKDKLKIYLRDFDFEVESMRSRFLLQLEAEEKHIRKVFHKLKMNLTQEQLNMKVEDFIATQNDDDDDEDDKEEDDDYDDEEDVAMGNTVKKNTANTKKKFQDRCKAIKETIPENKVVPQSTRPRRTRNTTIQTTGSSIRSRLVTPAVRQKPSALGFQTPMITPKFDPRLPVTPAETREAKVGEILMSLSGSPVIPRVTSKMKPPTDEDLMELEDINIPDESGLQKLKLPVDIHKAMSVFIRMVKKDDD